MKTELIDVAFRNKMQGDLARRTDYFLEKLFRSLNITDRFSNIPNVSDFENLQDLLLEYDDYIGNPKNGKSWEQRTVPWMQNRDTKFLCWDINTEGIFLLSSVTNTRELTEYDRYLPVFKSHNPPKFVSEIKQTTKETPKMKSLFDKVLDTNKESAVIAGKLTAGKAANDFIQDKLYKTLPWYARLFAKKKDAKNNALTKMVTANIAVALTQHFGKGNNKLSFLSEAMLQDAMVSFTRDSDTLEKFISELTDAVSVPDDVLKNFNKEQDQ